ncbi:MAG: DsrE family protein [Proteobacteria bacterium]|nr:DsrE family protein [Pseudomonadota bacterium]
MKSRILSYVLAFAAVLALSIPIDAYAQKVHRVAIHVDDSDPMRQNMALNNALNVSNFYEKKGEKVIIEVVAYGPGLMMLRMDKSKVKDRIAKMSLEMPNLSFAACGNTLNGMAKKEGKMPVLVAEAKNVPSGVVRLIELQEKGYAYIRP